MATRFSITPEPLSIERVMAEIEREVRATPEGCGAIASFVGVVRGQHRGRRVRHLDYEAYAPLALNVFARIADEAAEEWPGVVLAVHHRVGRLAVGEASVVVAAGSAHRDAACRACRYGIERVKQIAPIWKREFLDDGDEWIEGAIADPANEDARRQALERACA